MLKDGWYESESMKKEPLNTHISFSLPCSIFFNLHLVLNTLIIPIGEGGLIVSEELVKAILNFFTL